MVILALLPAPVVAAGPGPTTRPAGDRVRPIDWAALRGRGGRPAGRAARRLGWTGPVLRNAAVFCDRWLARSFARDAKRRLRAVGGRGEGRIRPPASAAFALAVAVRTGLVTAKDFGDPPEAVAGRAAEVVKGLAAGHRANGGRWGHAWQSALWAALAAHAGWMVWDDLDAEARRGVAAMVVSEADRFASPRYRPPFWNGRGGDTKAEENAWNAMILQLAAAMMPDHPHAAAWRRSGTALMISAYATEGDAKSNRRVIDGQAVTDWLAGGFNMRDDGRLINHGRIHPDYMCCATLSLRAHIVLPLAGRPSPRAAEFNARRVYEVMTSRRWPSPPYAEPGGTIYRPGKAQVYYPQGTDWSPRRLPIFACYDAYAAVRGWDERAEEWLRLRCEKMLAMQARHRSRNMYAKGEFRGYRGREQLAAWQMADAHLLLWLDARGRLPEAADWLGEKH